MLTRLHVVHGFNVRDGGAQTVDRLRAHGEAARLFWHQHDYGRIGLCGVRDRGLKIAREIARQVRPGDWGLGHSNGCMELLEAAWQGARFDRLIFINPALDSDAPAPWHTRRIDVWHVPGDLAVTLARYLPFHPWGAMGSTGYTGRDARWRNFNARFVSSFKGGGFAFPFWNRHSAIFQHADFFGPLIFKGED